MKPQTHKQRTVTEEPPRTVSKKSRGSRGEEEWAKLILPARNLALNSDAAQNYKYTFISLYLEFQWTL